MVAKNLRKRCLSCAGCVGVCPSDAISLKDMRIFVTKEKCINCGNCVKFCPVGAMVIE